MTVLQAYALLNQKIKSAVTGISSVAAQRNDIHFTAADGAVFAVTLPIPKDGVSVSDITVNDSNEIVFTMSDGSVMNSGKLPETTITVDDTLSKDSDNPISNKAVSNEFSNTLKTDKTHQSIFKSDRSTREFISIQLRKKVTRKYAARILLCGKTVKAILSPLLKYHLKTESLYMKNRSPLAKREAILQ